MPLMTKLWINNYISDISDNDGPLGFKIKNGAPGIAVLPYSAVEPAGTNNVCPPSSLFSPRYLRVHHTDGQTIQYPVGDRAQIETQAAALKAANNVLCMDLVGERWRNVPYGIIGGPTPLSPNTPYAPVGGTGKASKHSGVAEYDSDLQTLLGNIQIKFAIEIIPATVSNVFLNTCLRNAETGGATTICPAQVTPIKPRHWIAIHSVAPGAAPPITGKMSRKGINSNNDRGDIQDCGALVAPLVACLAYQGESIKNLHLLLP